MDITSDLLEQRLKDFETVVASARIAQAALIREADRRQLPIADGCRSLREWVASRLDVAPETASALTRVATAQWSDTEDVSFDRIAELVRLDSLFSSSNDELAERALSAAGDEEGRVTVHDSLRFDIAGLRRHIASCRRMTRPTEREAFLGRFISIQPNLDESFYRLWGQLPGLDGRTVEAALDRTADKFPNVGATLGQRRADALVSLSQGSSTDSSSSPLVSVFVDAARFTHGGETGLALEAGSRLGASALEELVCTGTVDLAATVTGKPLGVGRRTRIVPARLRRFVFHRDGACVVDACDSRYRLEAHHIVSWAEGGRTEADNLATLCWYHHHVAIHGLGLKLDPDSPTQRRRFLPP